MFAKPQISQYDYENCSHSIFSATATSRAGGLRWFLWASLYSSGTSNNLISLHFTTNFTSLHISVPQPLQHSAGRQSCGHCNFGPGTKGVESWSQDWRTGAITSWQQQPGVQHRALFTTVAAAQRWLPGTGSWGGGQLPGPGLGLKDSAFRFR